MTPSGIAEVLRPQGGGRFVLFCDHASPAIPPEFQGLGLAPSEANRHIGWDIGAAGVTAALAELLDSPAILCGFSRLVIDPNRQLHAPDLIPETSDGTAIPGNCNLDESGRTRRIDGWFRPYHDAVEAVLMERAAKAPPTIVISIHSMTPHLTSMGDAAVRPWQIALSSHLNRSLADPVLAALRRPGDLVVGDNQPYDLDPEVDYSIPYHAMRRSLRHLQVEFRQDEIPDAAAQRRWARRFAEALREGIPYASGCDS